MNNGEFGELGMIPNHLKQKSITYLWDNYNPFQYQGVDINHQIKKVIHSNLR
jgi:hypothetical protein